MTGRLKNPTISGENGFISILIDSTFPANKRGVIVKGKKSYVEKYKVAIKEFDEIEGLLYGYVYEAGVYDTDREFMKSSDLDFMLYDLMKNMTTTKMADINHDTKRLEDVYVCEIWRDKDESGMTKSVNICYNISENEFLLGKAKDKSINGFSIMGQVEDIIDEPLSKSEENSMIKDLWNKFFGKEEIIIKEEVSDMTKEEMIEFLKSDEGKELIKTVNELPPIEETTPETPEETPATEEAPGEAPEESEAEKALKAENEALKLEIETAKQALMAKTSKPDDTNDILDKREINKESFAKMDAWDRGILRDQDPELYEKLNEGK